MRNNMLVLALAAIASLLGQSSSSYRVTHTYALGGDGSWDYVVPDPPNHRLFIARQNPNHCPTNASCSCARAFVLSLLDS